MKIKVYLKTCILLIHLSVISGHLSSQITETIIGELADSTIYTTESQEITLFEQLEDIIGGIVQTRSCVSTFTNQTISSFMVVNGCNTLDVQDVTVSNGGDLYLLAPGDITINGVFDVTLGGQLNVHIALPCVNSFTNQTVSSYLSVVGCDTLFVQGVTVASGGDLHLSAPGDIKILGEFDVYFGGQLNIGDSTNPPVNPPGNTIQTAINIGTFGTDFQYSDTQNTTNFTSDYPGLPTGDVFYVFTVTTPMDITVRHCDSSIDTYLYLLDEHETCIAYNDDYSGPGACSNTTHAYVKQYLQVGTYYIVSKGKSANGNIQTAVIGEMPQYLFNYTYDASGNRTGRTVTP